MDKKIGQHVYIYNLNLEVDKEMYGKMNIRKKKTQILP